MSSIDISPVISSKISKKKVVKKVINSSVDETVKSQVDSNKVNVCDICMFQKNKCICQPFWSTFDADFAKVYTFKCNPTPLKISTITFNWAFKDTEIDLNMIRNKFTKSLFTREIKYIEKSKKSKSDNNLNYNFYNQGSITSLAPFADDPEKLARVSTKIFRSGSFTISGCRNISMIVYMVRGLLTLLSEYKSLISPVKLEISRSAISMINTNFSIESAIRQVALKDLLLSLTDFNEYPGHVKSVVFAPSDYRAVRIKYIHRYSQSELEKNTFFTRKRVEKCIGEVTINVFKTGSVIINGGNTSAETIGAYRFINQIFDNYADQILKPVKNEPKNKLSKIYNRKLEIIKLFREIREDQLQEHKFKFINIGDELIWTYLTNIHKLKYNDVIYELNSKV
jgi:TATA-box binding protein (TBP) (component of TFIID and TFIIIB)